MSVSMPYSSLGQYSESLAGRFAVQYEAAVFMMGYTVEEPPDCSAVSCSPPESPSVLPELLSELPELSGVEESLDQLEQPASATALATPVAVTNFRRETRSERRCVSVDLNRYGGSEY